MQDPGSVAQSGILSPDRMTSPNYFNGEVDQGGVHFNSGVNNKAAYLMTDGDTFNNVQTTGIGATKVGRVYYDALTTLLTSGSDYADLASALGQACDDLVGTNGFTAANCTQVRNATAAVEMTAQPPAAAAPEAPVCPAGQVANASFSDNLENGTANWTTSSTHIPAAPWSRPDDYAHSGSFSLCRRASPPSCASTTPTASRTTTAAARTTAACWRSASTAAPSRTSARA
jgi:hypothetical protein